MTRTGVAYILAVVLLAMFAALAVAFACETNTNVRVAQNHVHGQTAQFQAESGLTYLSRLIRRVSGLTRSSIGQQMLEKIAAQLPGLIGPTNLAGQSIVYAEGSSTIDVPLLATDDRGAGFSARLDLSAGKVRLQVTGVDPVEQAGPTAFWSRRSVRMQYQLSQGRARGFQNGIQTKGKVTLTGNASIRGGNGRVESGTVCIAPDEEDIPAGGFDAADFNGNIRVDGNVIVPSPKGRVTMTGNVSVGGEVRIGDEEDQGVEFPEADPSVFEPFATNIVDSRTSTNGNKTFTNIRIKAGTNPTFSGNITINGLMYVETPNRVGFAGNLNMTGMIVTQDAGQGALNDNFLKFAGNSTFRGVENLPNQPEFAGLKDLPGTFLLAPGFSTQFTGNFGTVNGAMAANEFKFAGNAGGSVYGGVVCWEQTEFKMVGNSCLTIHLPDDDEAPPGFTSVPRLEPVAGSYDEPLP